MFPSTKSKTIIRNEINGEWDGMNDDIWVSAHQIFLQFRNISTTHTKIIIINLLSAFLSYV